MEPRYLLRTSSQYVTAVGLAALGAILLVVQATQTGLRDLGNTGFFSAGLCLIAWAFYLMPHLEVNADGVGIHNTFRRIFIPFGQLAATETRWGLKLTPAKGRPIAVRSFGGSGSSRAYRATSQPIVLMRSGVHKMTASTRAAYNLIEDMREEFPPRKNPRSRELVCTSEWNIAALAVGAAGFAGLALGLSLTLS